MSVQPRYAEAILAGTKTVELRRRPPRDEPTVVIIYGSGKSREVLGTARLKEVHTSTPTDIWSRFGSRASVTQGEFDEYFAGSETATAIEVEAPKRSTEPLPLATLRTFDLEPPQSWRYLDRELTTHLVEALFNVEDENRRYISMAPRQLVAVAALKLLDVTLARIMSTLGRPVCALLGSVGHTRSFATGHARRRRRSEVTWNRGIV